MQVLSLFEILFAVWGSERTYIFHAFLTALLFSSSYSMRYVYFATKKNSDVFCKLFINLYWWTKYGLSCNYIALIQFHSASHPCMQYYLHYLWVYVHVMVRLNLSQTSCSFQQYFFISLFPTRTERINVKDF